MSTNRFARAMRVFTAAATNLPGLAADYVRAGDFNTFRRALLDAAAAPPGPTLRWSCRSPHGSPVAASTPTRP